LERRIARLEAMAAERSLVLLWRGARSADAVMLEYFGSTQAPAHLDVVMLCWADQAPGYVPPAPALVPPLVVQPDPTDRFAMSAQRGWLI
jgi:hypothetical protein